MTPRDEARKAAVEAAGDVLVSEGCGDSDQCEATAQRALAAALDAMAAAGWRMVREVDQPTATFASTDAARAAMLGEGE